MALTALGLSPMGANDFPAEHPEKPDAARRAEELRAELSVPDENFEEMVETFTAIERGG